MMIGSGEAVIADNGKSGNDTMSPDMLSPALAESLGA